MAGVSKYVRDTFIKLGDLTNESDQMSRDFADNGDFQSEIMQAAIDGIIVQTMPKEVLTLLKAFEMASITTQQAAQVMYLSGMMADKKN